MYYYMPHSKSIYNSSLINCLSLSLGNIFAIVYILIFRNAKTTWMTFRKAHHPFCLHGHCSLLSSWRILHCVMPKASVKESSQSEANMKAKQWCTNSTSTSFQLSISVIFHCEKGYVEVYFTIVMILVKKNPLNKWKTFIAGAMHLIRLMFDEYVLLVMETHHHKLEQQSQYDAFKQYLLSDGIFRFWQK